MSTRKSVILFDGDCAFCNHFINYVINKDGGIFKIATQNSNYFKEFLVEHHISPKGDDSIYVVHHNQVLKKSKAIKKILANCDAKGKFFSMMLALIPSRLADFGYDLFAKHRKKFYPNDVCSLPDKNFQARII